MSRSNLYHPQESPHRQTYHPSPNASLTRVAADSVQDAHRLFASYPFASATPSTHVTRHLGHLSIAAPPSYVQPYIYGAQAAPHSPTYFPQYSEFANELNHISSSSIPMHDGGYWERSRNEAVRYLGDQGSSYPYYQSPNQWSQLYQHSSTYQSNPFAQSMFQHSAPAASYPTPPPPGIAMSSSSLAYALGEPVPKPARTIYQPEDSAIFFNTFLTQTATELDVSRHASDNTQLTPPRPNVLSKEDDSPDPLALVHSGPQANQPTSRKRRGDCYLESPSVKRVQVAEPSRNLLTPHRSGTETKPSSPSSFKTTPTSTKKLQAYVDVPPLPKSYMTPTSSRRDRSGLRTLSGNNTGKRKVQEDDDLGGFGSEDDDNYPRMPLDFGNSVKSSSRRTTGERDGRAPLEKFMTLLEDIFEAEDSLSPDIDVHDLPAEFFSPLTTDGSRPLLQPSVIRKLMNCITKVARPSKRVRLSSREVNNGIAGTPRPKGRIAEVDTNILSRILKIMERSVRVGDDLAPFGSSSAAGDGMVTSFQKVVKSKKHSKKHIQRQDGRSKSDTPGPSTDARSGEEEIEPDTNESPTQQVTDADLENLTKLLDIARDSVLAADCCITLLGSDRLTKQLYSEELITACLTTIKNQLTRIVYPFVEASCDVFGHVPILLRRIVQPSSRDSSHRRQLAEIFQAISSVVPRINDLICADAMAMSEGIIIQAVYIAIGPFFVVDADGDGKGKKENAVLSTLGNSAMRGLRLDALSLIRGIFANHEDQRPWIIEEILASLIKLSDSKQRAGQFRLRDGQSIRTVSALLLQLVQTSAHDVRIGARTLHKARQQIFALRKQDNFDEKIKEPFLDDKDIEEIRLYVSGLDSATKAAKTIIIFLTQRSGKSKVTKNTNEAEYRAIFDNLISDLLVVLFWPEWPAASLVLSIICKFMVSSLDDVKTTSQNDNNAAKTVALDHLGVIAAHLRSSLLKFQQGGLGSESSSLVPLDEVLSTMNTKYFLKLVSAHQDLQSHLCKRSTEDQAYDSARELTAVTWGHELALVLQQCDRMIVNSGDGDFDSRVDRSKLLLFGLKVKDALRNLWEDAASDVFDMGSSHEEVARIDRLSEEIGTIQSFKNSFHPILNVVLQALDAPPVFMRTKALKALGQIVTSDPSILSASNVHEAIESHLLDSSPAVRDAAVELIGKYMIDSPKFASNYYQKIADRIADTGLGVRKRVIKLLKAVYNVTDDRSRRVDICTRIVLRMLDEDDTVKDLAIKTIEELWFQETLSPSLTQKGKVASQNAHDKTQLLAKVAVIMGVSSHFRDRQSPLEDLLHQLTVDRSDTETSLLRERYAETCEILIDGLVDASDLPGFTVVNCVRTIHLFTLAYPAVLSGTNASTLLPYLKNATTPEEQITSDYLLRIFRTSIPYMPRTAAKFGQELQLALQPMIIRPSSTAGILGLQETVACMCAVVRHITHDFGRVVALLRSCNVRLIQALTKPQSQSITAPEQRALTILLFIISLLCEHCNFDTLRVEHDDLRVDIDSITKGPVIEHVYRSLLRLYEKYADAGFRGRILQCLGFLFRAQPALMTADTSANIMDTIFSSPEEEVRGRLLKILQDFLISEATKHSANEKANAKSKATSGKVNMEELVGNTDGFADSGVSSAVVQRYLDPILKAALSRNPQIQSASVDILSFTIKQGLAHPLQSFPVIVALETSSNHLLSTRASALHTILHSKHTSLLNARYIVSARASFDYQKQLTTGQVQGYRMGPGPTALLQRWYSLVREKRASRQDFLRALVKVFDVELSSKTSQDDVDFTRYMAENFAAFEYKTQEEVLTVLKYLTAVLSTAGMQLVEMLSPSHLLTQLHAPPQDQIPHEVIMDVEGMSTLTLPMASVPQVHAMVPMEDLPKMRSSVIVAMIMLLKAHLKAIYGLSEEKCSKWVMGKKSAVGDKAATRRHERPLSWERLPFATAPMLTNEDAAVQRTRFLEIWSEDGLTAEPEDELA